MKTKTVYLAIVFLCNLYYQGQGQPLKDFPLSYIKIGTGPFYNAQQADLQYILKLNPDRLLAPYLIDAGIEPLAPRYGNWESIGLDGHTGGHYLSALSQMYAATGNTELLSRLGYMINWLDSCQKKNGNGYVAGIPDGKSLWKDIAEGKIDVSGFSLKNRWVPLYNIHKLYAGLRDAYLIAGNKKALDILIKLTDWCIELTKNLTDEQVQLMLRSEHGGLNEVYADVAFITGDDKYLALAKRFSHRLILDPLLAGEDKLTGLHANTQIPKVVGFKRIADLSGDKEWSRAADFFWSTVVTNRSVSIGGNSVREHFHPADNFSSMVESNQGPETCNTYNMLRLTRLLFLSEPQAKYMDYYEQALFNHILSTIETEQPGLVYFTPMRPRHYRVYSTPEQCFWCCVGTGMENHAKYGEMIYSHNEKDIYVNLFIASTLQWKEKGITVTQQTNFPYEQLTHLSIGLVKPQQFAIKIRYPAWVKNGEMKVKVNNKEVQPATSSSGYISIERKWKTNDQIDVEMPMHPHIEYLPDGSSWASVMHGPIVLAAVTDTSGLTGLRADDSRMGHVANGPLYPVQQAPMLVTEEKYFTGSIKPVPGKKLEFSMEEIIYPEKYKQITLKPFFETHSARYMVYWPVITPDSLQKKMAEMHEKEKEMLVLEARTTDQVAPGEQQPEKEHNFKGENTESGIHEGRHWRHAAGWFSYDLKNPGNIANILRVTYFGADRGRVFDIFINNMLLTTVKSDGSQGSRFFDVDYIIPDNILEKSADGFMSVKFSAHEGSVAGGVFYVRLMKD
ncbi:MAG: glycoside hydrolase family 127 protein [Bacteroidales bacterium]|nr:glycoside hydrolase family 127 protein [Bacteroidales bacterium]